MLFQFKNPVDIAVTGKEKVAKFFAHGFFNSTKDLVMCQALPSGHATIIAEMLLFRCGECVNNEKKGNS